MQIVADPAGLADAEVVSKMKWIADELSDFGIGNEFLEGLARKLLQEKGLADTKLSTFRAFEPPPLPARHVSRSAMFGNIAKVLDQNDVVCFFAYQSSGKTVTSAEFASLYPSECFWHTLRTATANASDCIDILVNDLSLFLNAETIDRNTISRLLTERGKSSPALIVLDNAGCISDLSSIDFIIQAVNSSNSALKLVLIATDEVDFLASLRAKPIACHKLPGFDTSQAISLYNVSFGEPTAHQSEAINALTEKYDGHVGLLKICQRAVFDIDNQIELESFLIEHEKFGGDAEQFYAALFNRFRNALTDGSLELCRRLTIAFRPFRKIFAERLWNNPETKTAFEDAWNFCLAGVFEPSAPSRFSLPNLYVVGLEQYNQPNESQNWHGLAADALQTPQEYVIDAFDFLYSIFHRLLSGQLNQAVIQATMLLAMAAEDQQIWHLRFLLYRLEHWLGALVAESDDIESRVIWFMTRTRMLDLVDQDADADSAASQLEESLKVLAANEEAGEPRSDLLSVGWLTLLVYDSKVGKTNRVAESLRHISLEDVGNTVVAAGKVYLAIWAYKNANESPLPFIKEVFESPESFCQNPADLWTSNRFEFWRSVGYVIYKQAESCAYEPEKLSQILTDLTDVFNSARKCDLAEVAVILRATQVRILIDISGKRNEAVAMATALLNLDGVSDPVAVAYAYQASGDALRCNGQYQVSISSYLHAVKTWPKQNVFERAQCHLHASIAYGRAGDLDKGVEQTQFARTVANEPVEMDMLSMKIHSELELAGFYLHKQEFKSCLETLELANQLIEATEERVPEIVPLSQLAIRVVSMSVGGNDLELPTPGFTLGIDDSMPGAKDIAPNAANFMIGYAHTALGNYETALEYFALAEAQYPDNSAMIDMLAAKCELKLENLASGTERLAKSLTQPEQIKGKPQELMLSNELIVEEVLILAIKKSGSSETRPELETAVAQADIGGYSSVSILAESLKAFSQAITDKDDTLLSSVYEVALASGLQRVARQLAWIWCYRYKSADMRLHEGEAALWFWRLSWLSLSIVEQDEEYFASTAEQIKTYWNQFSETEDFPLIKQVSDSPDDDATIHLTSLMHVFGKKTIETVGLKHLVNELKHLVPSFPDNDNSLPLISDFVARLFDCVLNTELQQFQATFKPLVKDLLAGIHKHSGKAASKWKEAIDDVLNLWTVFDVEKTSEIIYRALLKWRSITPKLCLESRANYFVALRHLFCPFGDNRTELMNRVFADLASIEVANLIDNKNLSDDMQIRLSTCHIAGKTHLAQAIHRQAIMALSVQEQARTIATQAAVSNAIANRNSSIEQIENCVSDLEILEEQAKTHEGLDEELWSICFDRGGLRKITATGFQLRDEDSARFEEWLNLALADFEKAAEYTQDDQNRLKALIEQLIIYKFFNRDAKRNELQKQIDAIRPLVDPQQYSFLVGQIESDILFKRDSDEDGARGLLKTEDQIQDFADKMMESLGLPEERRPNVVDDVRKLAATEEMQDRFCRYLQPMQNLMHTTSPATSYITKTKYTCDCTLLGYRTLIETDDIDVCFNAMKRGYCDGCDKRTPRV